MVLQPHINRLGYTKQIHKQKPTIFLLMNEVQLMKICESWETYDSDNHTPTAGMGKLKVSLCFTVLHNTINSIANMSVYPKMNLWSHHTTPTILSSKHYNYLSLSQNPNSKNYIPHKRLLNFLNLLIPEKYHQTP